MDALLIRPEEAARMLGIGRSKVYSLLSRGELPAVRVGHSVRVPLAALHGWIAERLATEQSGEEKGVASGIVTSPSDA